MPDQQQRTSYAQRKSIPLSDRLARARAQRTSDREPGAYTKMRHGEGWSVALHELSPWAEREGDIRQSRVSFE